MGSKARKKKRLSSAAHQSKSHNDRTASHDGHAEDDNNSKAIMSGNNSNCVQTTESGKVTSCQVIQRTVSVKEVLQAALSSIDHVIDEVYQVNKSMYNSDSNNSVKELSARKRTRSETNETEKDVNNFKMTSYEKSKLYAAMMQTNLSVVTHAITTFGVQLLPALNAIVQRLSHLLFFTGHNTRQGVCLSCSKVWEVLALTAMYYSSGVLSLVEELVQMLLATPMTSGPLLFGANIITYPFSFVDDFVCCIDDSDNLCKSTSSPTLLHQMHHTIYKYNNEILTEIQRKLIALNDMLSSCGQMINSRLLFSFANQFALDVMQNGILVHLIQSYTEEDTHLTPLRVSASAHIATQEVKTPNKTDNQRENEYRVAYKVHSELIPSCIAILNTLVSLCNPLPQALHTIAIQTVKLFHEALHRGAAVHTLFTPSHIHFKQTELMYMNEDSKNITIDENNVVALRTSLLKEIDQLRRTLHLVHHPHFIPAYEHKSHFTDEILVPLHVNHKVFVVVDDHNESNYDNKIEEKEEVEHLWNVNGVNAVEPVANSLDLSTMLVVEKTKTEMENTEGNLQEQLKEEEEEQMQQKELKEFLSEENGNVEVEVTKNDMECKTIGSSENVNMLSTTCEEEKVEESEEGQTTVVANAQCVNTQNECIERNSNDDNDDDEEDEDFPDIIYDD